VIEARSETALPSSMTLSIHDTSCLLPRAATIDPQRKTLLVACLGTDEIDEYDATAPDPLAALRGRWKVPSGPTGIAVDGDRLLVWSSFDRMLTLIGRGGDVDHVSTVDARAPTPFEVGRKIFHASGRKEISSDGRACASCHPDGRDDGLTWTSPEGPRQTPMLAGRLEESAPFGWTGGSRTVREHLNHTLARLEGLGLSDRATYALLTYVSQMKTPHRTPRSEPAKLARGSALFRSYEAGCSSCHMVGDRPIGDGETHDVGSAARGDVSASLGTPSLQFVGGTGPYFHDGRYATLPELLRATDGKMGSTSHLSSADLDALTTYVESL
jgi:mono/diheme cytochrome c family protein